MGSNNKASAARMKDLAKNNEIYRTIKQFECILKDKPYYKTMEYSSKRDESIQENGADLEGPSQSKKNVLKDVIPPKDNIVLNYFGQMQDYNKDVLNQILWNKTSNKIFDTSGNGKKGDNAFEKFKKSYVSAQESGNLNSAPNDNGPDVMETFNDEYVNPAFTNMKNRVLLNYKVINKQFDTGFMPDYNYINEKTKD